MKRILLVGLIAIALFAYLEYSPKIEIKGINKFSVNDVSLIKENGSWKLEKTSEIPVNEGTVKSFVSGIEGISFKEELKGIELPEPIKLRIKINYGKEESELIFGKENEYLSKTYLKFKEKIYLVPSFIEKSLDKKFDDFREKRFIKVFPYDLSKMILKKGQEEIYLTHDQDWKIKEIGKASENVVREIISEIRGLSADEIIFNKTIENPDLVVELVKSDGKNSVLKIKRLEDGSSKSGDEPILFSFSDYNFIAKTRPNPINRIFKPVKEIREKNQFSFSPAAVKRLEVTGSHNVTIEKTDKGFLVDSKEGDTTFVNEYLSTLSNLQAVDYPSTSFSTDELKFRLILNDDSEKILEIGRSQGGTRVAKSEEFFYISEESYKKIIPKLEQLLPAK